MRNCTSCGTAAASDTARFCAECGAGLDLSCGACGTSLPAGSRFCPGCGAAQGGAAAATPALSSSAGMPVASRRVTSVLFGDLVSFTAYSESRDQEEVRELLSAYFEECSRIVARYGGTLEKFIGDAVMAVWGVPVANEDDAERAVRAGLELVNRIEAMGVDLHIPELAMRVGIVTGEVAVTIGATQQGMVAGDAVNTAARVQSAAAAGQVWVDETTRLLTASAISYVDVGSHRMKGKADPVPLWAVRAVVANVGGAQRADGLEAPLVGRHREMRLVKEIFHAAEESGRPSLLVVDGEAGVGKSRMAWEFEKYADGLSTSTRWHNGRCLSYGEGVAYFALAEAIRGRLQLTQGSDPDDDVEPSELLESGLARYVPDLEEQTWLRPRLGALLGTGAVGTFPREDLFAAWTAFLRRVGEDDPVVLVIDDAQYADEGLLRFLDYLLGVGDFSCFVMLLARPQLLADNPALATNRRATVLHLDTLSARDMAVLLDGLVAGLPDDVRESLVARAEGIPLFAVETIRSLVDRDLVVPRGGQYVLADDDLDLDQIGAPASLQALIAARLDALPPGQRRVLDQASVLGLSFERESIDHLCADVEDLDAVLASLVRVQLLRQESNRFSAEAGHYQFVQGVVRQVAYATISRRDRRARHLAVAALLEGNEDAAEAAAVIAQHYLEAIDAIPDADDVGQLNRRAVQHLERAAARAAALGAPAEAAGHLRVALSRAHEPTQSASIEADLAKYLNRSGDYEEALHHGERARDELDRLDEPLRAAAAVCSIAEAMNGLRRGDDELLALVDARLAALDGVEGATPVMLELARRKGGTLLRLGGDMRENAELQARLADRLGDPIEIADAHMGMGLHYSAVGPPSIARLLLRSAASLAREAHDTMQLTRALVNLNAHLNQDDAAEGLEVGVEACKAARMTGDPLWLSYARINRLIAEFVNGNWDEVDAPQDEMVADNLMQGYLACLRAGVRRARQEVVDMDWSAPGGTDDRIGEVLDLLLHAFEAAERDAPDTGRLAVAALTAEHELTNVYDDFSVLFLLATDLVRDAGDREALDDLLALVGRAADMVPPTGVRAVEARLRGLLAIDDGAEPAAIETLLNRAITEASDWKSRPLVARIQAELGGWLRSQGREAEGDALLAEARPVLEGLRAARWLRELDAALTGVSA